MAVLQANIDYLWSVLVRPRLGVAPYVWGGSFQRDDVHVGTDCSGAVSAELEAMLYGPRMHYQRQFWTGTFAGAQPGQRGPFGGVACTADLVCVANLSEVPADAPMVIAVRQRPQPGDSHMICAVQGVPIEMGGPSNSYVAGASATPVSSPEFDQYFYLPGPVVEGERVTLFGVDLSNVNYAGPTGTDMSVIPQTFAQVAAAGYSWIEFKCSQGSDFIDPYFSTAYQWCVSNAMPFIAYHYLDTSDAASQAQNCVAALNGASCAVFLDFEDGGGDMNNFWAVYDAFQGAGINVAVPHYIPRWYWENVGSPSLAGLPAGVISSGYPGGSGYGSQIYAQGGGDNGPGWEPYGGATPAIWQFTDQASVAGMNVDANAFVGTLTQLQQTLGGAAAPANGGDGFLMALTDAQQQDIYNWCMWTYQQLAGILTNNPGNVSPLPGSPTPTGSGWPQDGHNSAGQNLTLVDALSVTEANVNSIGSYVAALLQAVVGK